LNTRSKSDRPHWPVDQGCKDLGITAKVRHGTRFAPMIDAVDREDDAVTGADAKEAVDAGKTGERNICRDVGSREPPTPTIGKRTVSGDFVLHAEPVAPRHAWALEGTLDDHGQ